MRLDVPRGPIGAWTPRQLREVCVRLFGVTLAIAVVIASIRAWISSRDPGLSPDEVPGRSVADALRFVVGAAIELIPVALVPVAVLVFIWLWRRR